MNINRRILVKSMLLIASVFSFSLIAVAAPRQEHDDVKVVVVKKKEVDVKKKKQYLKDNKCEYLGDFAVNVDLATTMLRQRKMDEVKKKAFDMDGNTVMSSLENDGSLPPRLKGLVYKCPEDFSPNNDVDSI